MAEKKHYVGRFNICRDVLTESVDAYTERQALFLMCNALALKTGTIRQAVWQHLKAGNTYEIKEQKCQH